MGGKMISQYVKKNNGTKIGVLVATLNSKNQIVIGHSKRHTRLDDNVAGLGMRIAVNRALTDRGTPAAKSLAEPMSRFVTRAKKYFKTDEISENTMKILRLCGCIKSDRTPNAKGSGQKTRKFSWF